MAGNMDGSMTTNGASGGKSRRGFASMDPSRQREIASKGGRAAHQKGTAHEWSSDEARSAGQKGGIAVSRDRAHMAAIGREGGESRSRASRAARETGGPMSDRELSRPVSRDGDGRHDGRADFGGRSASDEARL
jgi:general stress protein YciG